VSAPELSVVIPTFNERASIQPLLADLCTAMEGIEWEALFVDDSTDGTDAVIASQAASNGCVRLLHRSENRGGLAGAVVDGLTLARGTFENSARRPDARRRTSSSPAATFRAAASEGSTAPCANSTHAV
jgi:glycosyltransferase involved in cell wall biosynthesis